MVSAYTYSVTNGIVIPDTADIKEQIQEEFKTALGADISLDDGTPQGRLIDIETDARVSVIQNNALVANQFNFNLAFGRSLDMLGANFSLFRTPASSSSVIATLTGEATTVIPAGSQVQTEDGDIFYLENTVTIPANNTITARFLSLEKAPIPAPVGSLTKIIDGTLGWETINNTVSATLGTFKENDYSFKQKFYDAGLFGGTSLLEDYKNELQKVENIKSSFVYDNYTNESIVYDTVTIKPHSLYACVDGGSNEDVARALLNRKSVGCDYTGNTTVAVTEPSWGVSYNVSFDRPTNINTFYEITVSSSDSSSPDLETSIKNAIVEYINNLKIGVNVSPFQLATFVSENVTGVLITNLEIGTTAESLSVSEIVIHINQTAMTNPDNITVIINE